MPHDDLPNDTGMTLRDRHVALYRDPGGELHAISSVCTHRGCDVAERPGQDLGLPLPRLPVHAGGRGHQGPGGHAAAGRRHPELGTRSVAITKSEP